MNKKILTIFLALLLSIVLIGCNDTVELTTTEVEKTNNSSQFDFDSNITIPELDVDGIDDDDEWDNATNELVYGNNGNVTVKMYLGDEALFVYFEVLDTNIMTLGYNNGDDVTRSDSVEFYIDTDNDASPNPQDGDFQINIGAHGKARILSGSGGSWGTWNGMIDYAVVLNGTINDESDTDTSYTVELMLPYEQIGLEKTDTFGFSLGHVDKETSGNVSAEDYGWYGFAYNSQFSDPQIPSKYIVLLDGSYYNRDALPLENITLSGIVSDNSDSPLAGVTVSIEGTDKTTVSDALGAYSFTDVDRNTGFTIVASKDGYIAYTVSMTRQETEDLSAIKHNISLINASTVQYTDLSLTVINVLNPLVNGVTVKVSGTTIEATSNASGLVSISDIPVTSTITLLLEKDGYRTEEVVIQTNEIVVDGITDLGQVEMFIRPFESFYFAGSKGINGFTTEIVRGIDGIHINFITDTAFEASEAIEMFIDTKESGTTRDATDYRVNFSGDGSISILQWGTETVLDTATSGIIATVTPDGDGAIIDAFIPYSFLDITPSEIFGVSFGCWSGVVNDWDGWGYNGFIAPEIPSQYVRVGIDNTLYKADSNVSVVTISGNAGLENIKISVGDNFILSDASGDYSIIITEASSYELDFSLTGYVSQTETLLPSAFTNGLATVDVTLVAYLNSLTGTISEDSVTVTVVGEEIVTTSTDGGYSISDIPTDAELTVTFEKEGFVTVTITLTVEDLNGEAIVEDITMISSTTVGTINGTVTSYEGLVCGATLAINGTDYTTTTNELGVYSFVDVVQDNYTITVSYTDYENIEYIISASDYDIDHEIVITKAPGLTGVFSGKDSHEAFDPIEGLVVREADGIRITFTTSEEFAYDGTSKEVIEFFIDTKTSETSRDETDYLFMLRSDGTLGIVNWNSGGNEDASTLVFTQSSQEMELFIPYAFLGIDANEIFGISMGEWNDFASDWDGWVFNGTFVAPENPQAYVRVAADNQLYEATSNEPIAPPVPGETGLFATKTTHEAFDSISGFILREETGVRMTFTTLEEFQFDGTNMDKIELFIDTAASGTSRDETDYLFILKADGTVQIVNWNSGGNEDTATIVFTCTAREMEVFIPYAFLGITATDVFGISLGEWSDFASDWDGWSYNETFIAPENPQAYVRVGLDNLLYVADNNDVVVEVISGETGLFATKATHEAFDSISGFITREAEGFRFIFTTEEEFVFDGTNKEVIELFLDTGLSGTTRDETDYLIMLRSDGTIGIVNWNSGGNEDASTLVFTFESQKMEVFIPYAFLGVTSEDIIGVSMGEWNDFAADWDGWSYNGTFIAPENPQAYVRVGLDNLLYEATSNEVIVNPGLTGEFATKTSHEAFDSISGEIVRGELGVTFTFTTAEEFQVDGTTLERIELFIDTGASGTSRDETDYLFMLRSDGTIGIVNWNSGGNEDTSTIVYTFTSTEMVVYIPYAFLEITSTDVFGISIGEWSDFASDWDGWSFNGSFVAPENPQAYIRVGLDNQLYEAASN
ncbi:MAG: carboxypeptidase regulatory-like domain-containing protein [Tenericutes bacterium]|nr:carboxypeptidase regulatory-like domain-containing protein [Mycoplasmatota bacterium]